MTSLCFLIAVSFCATQALAQTTRTRNVVLIVSDGLRWQEVFRGADPALIDGKAGGVDDTLTTQTQWQRANPTEARRALMPFFWNTIAIHGQLYGDRDAGGAAQVTNGFKFSYPGYNEMLSGHPDPRINSNDAGPNPNLTVFEWLASLPAYSGRVAAFGTWNEFDDIFNERRSGIPVFAGWELPFAHAATPREALLDSLYATTTQLWPDLAYDAFMQETVLDYLPDHHPRAMFIGYGETDEYAHMRRYDEYLASAHRFDQFVAQLWNTMQAMPQYHDSTTFIITADHGRGDGAKWTDHGRDVNGAENIWIAVIGPDTKPLGDDSTADPVTQSQIAATLAALLGQDYRKAVPAAAAPVPAMLRDQP